MVHLVSLLTFGDNVLTLSAIERHPGAVPQITVLGSAVTESVARYMGSSPRVIRLLPDAGGFYTSKASGLRRSVHDLLSARRQIRELTRDGDTIGFERDDFRTRLLAPRARRLVYLRATQSAYEDRAALIASLLGGASVTWPACARPDVTIRKVLINPCARNTARELASPIIDRLLDLGRDRNWEVTLLDPDSRFAAWSGSAARYVPDPPLPHAVEALRSADLYIGPDSFFVHLAYYFRVPFFGFFSPDWLYFAPPGMLETGNWLSFAEARQAATLVERLSAFCDRSSGQPH